MKQRLREERVRAALVLQEDAMVAVLDNLVDAEFVVHPFKHDGRIQIVAGRGLMAEIPDALPDVALVVGHGLEVLPDVIRESRILLAYPIPFPFHMVLEAPVRASDLVLLAVKGVQFFLVLGRLLDKFGLDRILGLEKDGILLFLQILLVARRILVVEFFLEEFDLLVELFQVAAGTPAARLIPEALELTDLVLDEFLIVRSQVGSRHVSLSYLE